MSSKSKRNSFAVFGVVAIIVTAFALFSSDIFHQQDSAAERSAELIGEMESAPEVVDASREEAVDNPVIEGGSKRIVHVPDTRSTAATGNKLQPGDVTGRSAAQFGEEVIEMGLGGDITMANSIRSLTEICSRHVPKDAESLEQDISIAMSIVGNLASSGRPIPAEGQPWQQGAAFSVGPAIWLFPNEVQYRQHILEWQTGCKQVNEIFADGLRGELENLAQNGHVMARFMYAMWKPDPGLEEQALERILRWQMNSVEFSYANVMDGEPVGYLAFGQSFAAGIFTQQNMRLAHLMLNAAYQCGLESPAITGLIKRFENDGMGRSMGGFLGLTGARFDELTAQLSSACE